MIHKKCEASFRGFIRNVNNHFRTFIKRYGYDQYDFLCGYERFKSKQLSSISAQLDKMPQ